MSALKDNNLTPKIPTSAFSTITKEKLKSKFSNKEMPSTTTKLSREKPSKTILVAGSKMETGSGRTKTTLNTSKHTFKQQQLDEPLKMVFKLKTTKPSLITTTTSSWPDSSSKYSASSSPSSSSSAQSAAPVGSGHATAMEPIQRLSSHAAPPSSYKSNQIHQQQQKSLKRSAATAADELQRKKKMRRESTSTITTTATITSGRDPKEPKPSNTNNNSLKDSERKAGLTKDLSKHSSTSSSKRTIDKSIGSGGSTLPDYSSNQLPFACLRNFKIPKVAETAEPPPQLAPSCSKKSSENSAIPSFTPLTTAFSSSLINHRSNEDVFSTGGATSLYYGSGGGNPFSNNPSSNNLSSGDFSRKPKSILKNTFVSGSGSSTNPLLLESRGVSSLSTYRNQSKHLSSSSSTQSRKPLLPNPIESKRYKYFKQIYN